MTCSSSINGQPTMNGPVYRNTLLSAAALIASSTPVHADETSTQGLRQSHRSISSPPHHGSWWYQPPERRVVLSHVIESVLDLITDDGDLFFPPINGPADLAPKPYPSGDASESPATRILPITTSPEVNDSDDGDDNAQQTSGDSRNIKKRRMTE